MNGNFLPTTATTEFDALLADEPIGGIALSKAVAQNVFVFFKNSPLFRWSDANNDCEDRANAICLLLDAWGIANYKAWVFGGNFRRREAGELTNNWKYHVAAALPVQERDGVVYCVIDPATSAELISIDQWALQITGSGKSYYFIKHNNYYIFPSEDVTKTNWHKRNKRNYRWTMQGLSGINGVSPKGRAQLAFETGRVKKTEEAFKKLKNNRPVFED